ncbi:MAG: acetyl-CoA C-acetyltransferase, partial [Myxococcales bacterium]|nr:acetyl-CoA C-acetyltransferase [Myxococcales bacterium]
MNMSREVVIVSAARTPIGSFQGALAPLTGPQLGAAAIKAALERAKLDGKDVDEVLMGTVLPAGVGQAPARQAAKAAGIPDAVGALTLNKVCGSGLKAVMLAAQAIKAGDGEIFVAGGMESMSNVPYLLPGAREGLRLFNKTLVDGLVHDGLWDPYNDFHMGNAGELCAAECGIGRERQDDFAAESYRRAQNSIKEGYFKAEITPVEVPGRKGPTLVEDDEEPFRGDIAKLPTLRAAFKKDGTV